eukprot:COSAG01_NODE_44257_length_420_cov_54.264798_1_plen_61_part_10
MGAGVSCHNKKKGHVGGVTSGRYHLGTVTRIGSPNMSYFRDPKWSQESRSSRHRDGHGDGD